MDSSHDDLAVHDPFTRATRSRYFRARAWRLRFLRDAEHFRQSAPDERTAILWRVMAHACQAQADDLAAQMEVLVNALGGVPTVEEEETGRDGTEDENDGATGDDDA